MSEGKVNQLAKEKNDDIKNIEIDTGSGSMAYNRFEFQLSETLHMAIELYDSLDYLLILDYYDDITLFDNEVDPQFVSYYQVKSNEEKVTINTAIKEDWLAKLYAQLSRSEWTIGELGLITNCPLKATVTVQDENGKQKRNTYTYKSEKTPFQKFNEETVNLIRADIAKKFEIDPDEVDLSKFVHMRTTLSLASHRELVEQQMSSFLYNKHPKISVETVKTVYNSMIDILTKRQQYEELPANAKYSLVRQKKGLSKNDFSRIIDEAIVISIPTFAEIERFVDFKEDKYKATYEYTRLMTDSQGRSETFTKLFRRVKKEVEDIVIDNSLTLLDNLKNLCDKIYSEDKTLQLLYNETYVCVLATCILINEARKE